jgi:hypothetical protein
MVTGTDESKLGSSLSLEVLGMDKTPDSEHAKKAKRLLARSRSLFTTFIANEEAQSIRALW